jgi:TPR repeat protein
MNLHKLKRLISECVNEVVSEFNYNGSFGPIELAKNALQKAQLNKVIAIDILKSKAGVPSRDRQNYEKAVEYLEKASDNDIKSMFTVVRESGDEGSDNLLSGQSNQVAATRVNKLLGTLSRGLFSDDGWQAVHNIFAKLKESGIDVYLLDAKYGGHGDSGLPTYKEWRISIPFTNNKGKPIELVGQITAHGAGSVANPLDRYDITAYVTAMAAKKMQESGDS